jgi:hypothetical protein
MQNVFVQKELFINLGVDFMIIGRFYDHCFRRISPFHVMINFLSKLAVFLSTKRQLFRQYFPPNIIKIITLDPGHIIIYQANFRLQISERMR